MYFIILNIIIKLMHPVFNNNDRMEIMAHDFYQNLQLYK